jgi:hypothetical protein
MKNFFLLIPFALLSFFNTQSSPKIAGSQTTTGTVKMTFVNTVKGKPLELNTGKYINPFGEEYSISKFKYYISHVSLLRGKAVFFEPENFHLVNESNADALHFSFDLDAGNYSSLNFMLGVDSLHNVSGAQTGALDPLNDMFWTWNSGYVMAKVEGHSPQAKQVNNKFEFHIGGFMGENNVLKNITLPFPSGKSLNIQDGKTSEIIIEADIATWWQQPNDIKIAEHPVCSSPGPLAKKIADNYSKMFRIKDIIN